MQVTTPAVQKTTAPRWTSTEEGGDAVHLITSPDRTSATDSRARREAAAEERVVSALVALERAQRLVEEATQALSGVSGLVREWRSLGALHERVRRAWYDVRGRSDSLCLEGRLLLDHEAGPGEAPGATHRRGR